MSVYAIGFPTNWQCIYIRRTGDSKRRQAKKGTKRKGARWTAPEKHATHSTYSSGRKRKHSGQRAAVASGYRDTTQPVCPKSREGYKTANVQRYAREMNADRGTDTGPAIFS